jgi:hypothetical protein
VRSHVPTHVPKSMKSSSAANKTGCTPFGMRLKASDAEQRLDRGFFLVGVSSCWVRLCGGLSVIFLPLLYSWGPDMAACIYCLNHRSPANDESKSRLQKP